MYKLWGQVLIAQPEITLNYAHLNSHLHTPLIVKMLVRVHRTQSTCKTQATFIYRQFHREVI